MEVLWFFSFKSVVQAVSVAYFATVAVWSLSVIILHSSVSSLGFMAGKLKLLSVAVCYF